MDNANSVGFGTGYVRFLRRCCSSMNQYTRFSFENLISRTHLLLSETCPILEFRIVLLNRIFYLFFLS